LLQQDLVSTLTRAGCPPGDQSRSSPPTHTIFSSQRSPLTQGWRGRWDEKMDPAPTEPFYSSSPLSNPRGRMEAAAKPRRLTRSPPGRHARITDVPAPSTA
jgi:hypothetical protein